MYLVSSTPAVHVRVHTSAHTSTHASTHTSTHTSTHASTHALPAVLLASAPLCHAIDLLRRVFIFLFLWISISDFPTISVILTGDCDHVRTVDQRGSRHHVRSTTPHSHARACPTAPLTQVFASSATRTEFCWRRMDGMDGWMDAVDAHITLSSAVHISRLVW